MLKKEVRWGLRHKDFLVEVFYGGVMVPSYITGRLDGHQWCLYCKIWDKRLVTSFLKPKNDHGESYGFFERLFEGCSEQEVTFYEHGMSSRFGEAERLYIKGGVDYLHLRQEDDPHSVYYLSDEKGVPDIIQNDVQIISNNMQKWLEELGNDNSNPE